MKLMKIKAIGARKIACSFNKGIANSIHAIHWHISLNDVGVKFARLLQQLGPDLQKRLLCNQRINKVRSQQTWYNCLVSTTLHLTYKLMMRNKLKWLPAISHNEWISKDGVNEKIISHSLHMLKSFKYCYLLSHGKVERTLLFKITTYQ